LASPALLPDKLAITNVKPRWQQVTTDLGLILLLCLPVYFLALTTQIGDQIGFGDNPWYLNRAFLIGKGVLDDSYVYTIVYPLLTAALNAVTHELILSGMAVNALALCGLSVGVYLLGRALYNRPVGLLAAIVITANPSLYTLGRLFSADTVFMLAVLACVLAALLAVRRPGFGTAALLGFLVTVTMYTRFEGSAYAILFLVVAWVVYRTRRDWRPAAGLVVSSSILGAGTLYYFSIFGRELKPDSRSTFALVQMLTTVPFRADLFSNRVTDALVNTLAHWPIWAWWVVFAGVIWSNTRYRLLNFALICLIALNIAYIFVLSGWPFESYLSHYLPVFAVLFAASLWHLTPSQWRVIVIPLLVALVTVPGLLRLLDYSKTSPGVFRTSPLAADAAQIDAWLAERNWQTTEVYSLCPPVVPFSKSYLHLIYRLAPNYNSADNWNSPRHLIPQMRETRKLLLVCSAPIYFADWQAYFADPGMYADRLEEVGRIGDYVFYAASNAP
jgi:4-amino-4-deoxy-L-arabinose transferase-like glycosyltransferase